MWVSAVARVGSYSGVDIALNDHIDHTLHERRSTNRIGLVFSIGGLSTATTFKWAVSLNARGWGARMEDVFFKVWKDDDNQNHNHNKCTECESSRRSHEMGTIKFHYSILAIGGDGMRSLISRLVFWVCVCIFIFYGWELWSISKLMSHQHWKIRKSNRHHTRQNSILAHASVHYCGKCGVVLTASGW